MREKDAQAFAMKSQTLNETFEEEMGRLRKRVMELESDLNRKGQSVQDGQAKVDSIVAEKEEIEKNMEALKGKYKKVLEGYKKEKGKRAELETQCEELQGLEKELKAKEKSI